MLPFLPSYLEEINDIFDGDSWPYGLEANRKPLEALVTYLEDQAMIPLEELFAPIYGRISRGNHYTVCYWLVFV